MSEPIAGDTVRDRGGDPAVLVVEADLPMAPDEAYRYWTDPQRLARRWAPDSQIQPTVGGAYRFSWPHRTGTWRARLAALPR